MTLPVDNYPDTAADTTTQTTATTQHQHVKWHYITRRWEEEGRGQDRTGEANLLCDNMQGIEYSLLVSEIERMSLLIPPYDTTHTITTTLSTLTITDNTLHNAHSNTVTNTTPNTTNPHGMEHTAA